MRAARWIRLGQVDSLGLRANCEGLAASVSDLLRPIVLWGRAMESLSLGPEPSRKGAAAPALECPVQETQYCAEPASLVYALLVPLRLAPGRPASWAAWGLAPALATYRAFGVRAYLEGSAIWLHGRHHAASRILRIGNALVVASSFPAHGGRMQGILGNRQGSPNFDFWGRGGRLVCTTPGVSGELPSERDVEGLLQARIEAQHGWRFENSWPDAGETNTIEQVWRSLETLGSH